MTNMEVCVCGGVGVELVLKRCLYPNTIPKIDKSRTVGIGKNKMFFNNHADTSARKTHNPSDIGTEGECRVRTTVRKRTKLLLQY